MTERRKGGPSRRTGVDRRAKSQRRKSDRVPQARGGRVADHVEAAKAGTLQTNRRRGPRRTGADRRGSTDRRGVGLRAILIATGSGSRLVPSPAGSIWLDAKQAAAQRRKSKRQIYRLHSIGAIHGIRPSGKAKGALLFRKSEIDAV